MFSSFGPKSNLISLINVNKRTYNTGFYNNLVIWRIIISCRQMIVKNEVQKLYLCIERDFVFIFTCYMLWQSFS